MGERVTGLGDSIMVSGQARVQQLRDPRKCRVTWMGKSKASLWSEVWRNNPRIAGPKEEGDFQELVARDMTNMRPYHLSKSETRWTYNLAFRPEVGEIYLTDEEKAFGANYPKRIIIEPHIKQGASPNKAWGNERWEAFVLLCKAAGLRLAHMGSAGVRPLTHVELISTPNFRLACAVLANARAYVGHEGGMHHAAAALGIRGVVIFGSFTPVELTGYALHRNLGVSLEKACGFRVPCEHCKIEMAKITPEQVFGELKGILIKEALK